MSSENPYLSIITPCRNDDHGGDFIARLQVGLDGLTEQLERHRIESEVILVEWNPPIDKRRLIEVIKWNSASLTYCTIRVIEVPSEVHDRYAGHDKIPMNVVAAMNCGIRRARGKFVLPRPADLIYSEELVSCIARKELKVDQRYRIDRCDVDRNVVHINDLDERLDFCAQNVIRINEQTIPEESTRRSRRSLLPDLHTNASGDFQLMSRHYWTLLRGYLEIDLAGAYVDGILSYASHAAGVREVVLGHPMRLYHIDHDDKFNNRISIPKLPLEKWFSLPLIPNWLRRKMLGLYRKVLTLAGHEIKSSVHGVPTLEFSAYRNMCHEIVAGKRAFVLGDDSWGLGEEDLKEVAMNTAVWDRELGVDKERQS